MSQAEISARAEAKRMAVLEVVRRNPGISAAEIERELGMRANNVLQVLRIKGLIENRGEGGRQKLGRWFALSAPLAGRSVFELGRP